MYMTLSEAYDRAKKNGAVIISHPIINVSNWRATLESEIWYDMYHFFNLDGIEIGMYYEPFKNYLDMNRKWGNHLQRTSVPL